MKNKTLFKDIAGYNDVKRELMDIYSWYQDKSLINNKDINLPKGILLYGNPGNGKTLFLREFINAINKKTFVVEGSSKDLAKEVHNVYANARKEEFAVVVIDELDLLITKNPIVVRAIQSELDGINTKGKIITLATSNSRYHDLPDPLIRPGRFDRCIEISNPSNEDITEIIKHYLNKLKVNYEQIDLKHLSNMLLYLSCADIKSIINDSYLRAKNNIKTRDIELSYERLIGKDYSFTDPIKYKNKRTAIHEAGHAIMALRFSNHFNLYNAKFTKFGGVTNTYAINSEEDTIEKRLEQIQIALSGALAEKIFFKKHDFGLRSDVSKAYRMSMSLIDKGCVNSFGDFYDGPFSMSHSERIDSESHHCKNEKKAKHILKKQTKLAFKYLKRHKSDIEEFAYLLYEKGEVNLYDIKQIKNKINNEPISSYIIPKHELVFTKEVDKLNREGIRK